MHKQMRGAASCALTERVTLCSKISRNSVQRKLKLADAPRQCSALARRDHFAYS